MKKIPFLIIASLLIYFDISAQSLVAGRICGTAKSYTGDSGRAIIYTAATCPTCGSLEGERGSLNGGFPVDNTDCFSISMEFDSGTSECGTNYDFFYTGNADLDSVSFEWNFGENGFPQTSDQANPIGVAYSSIGEKTITLTVSDGECILTIMGQITAEGIGFSSNPIATDVSCGGGEDGTIALETSGGNEPFDFNWSNSEIGMSIENLAAGEYSYTITDAVGCETVNTLTLSEPEAIVPDFQVVNETCRGDFDGSIELSISGGIEPYEVQWEDDNSVDLIRSNLDSKDYTVTIRDANDCETMFSIFVNRNCEPKIYDTISPNGDDVNDIWIVPGIEDFPNNEVRIYNRWGEAIYEKNGYANDWRGTTTDGKKLSDGAYYYVLKYNDEADTVVTGSVTIIR